MADISSNPNISRDYSSYSLPTPQLDQSTTEGANAAQLVRVANSALAAFLAAFPQDGSAITGAGRSDVDADVSGINALLTGEIDANTLQAIAAILLGELSKSKDAGEATAIAQESEYKSAISDLQQIDYEEINSQITEAKHKQDEARILEIAGYALIAAGTALLGVPFVGWVAGPALIAAGAALLIAAKVINDQADALLREAAAGTAALQDAEAAAEDVADTIAFDKLQQAFGTLAATTITTNVNAVLNILGLADFPNDLAAALEPALAQSYSEQGLPPGEAAAKAKIDSLAAANVLTTVLVSTLALSGLAGTQENSEGSATIVRDALTSGLQSASEALQSLVGGDTPIDLNTLGEAVIDAAGEAIFEYFESQTETLAGEAPNEEAANALRGAVGDTTQESVALLGTVVPGLFSAQQTVQGQVGDLVDLSDQENPNTDAPLSLDNVAAQLGQYLTDLQNKLTGLSSVTADSITAQEQGTSAREHVPGLA